MKTKITDLLKIKYPIVQGGMMWVGTADMAAAVSNAGGLGMITALTFSTPEALRKEIECCRTMTAKPFGVNVTVLPSITPPPYEEYLQVIIESGIKIVETAGNSPEPFMPYFKKAGILVIHKCTSVRHALKAESVGCDIVSIDGFECAGHPGEDDVTNLVLIPAAVSALKIPILASGGIGTGSQLAACLALGAEGINMGSRFVATQEAPVHENMKEAILNASEKDTTLIFRSLKNTARVFKNSIALKVREIEAKPGDTNFADLRPLVSGKIGKTECIEKGNLEGGIWTVGMVTGLINEIPTCKELLDGMVNEAESIIKNRLQQLVD